MLGVAPMVATPTRRAAAGDPAPMVPPKGVAGDPVSTPVQALRKPAQHFESPPFDSPGSPSPSSASASSPNATPNRKLFYSPARDVTLCHENLDLPQEDSATEPQQAPVVVLLDLLAQITATIHALERMRRLYRLAVTKSEASQWQSALQAIDEALLIAFDTCEDDDELLSATKTRYLLVRAAVQLKLDQFKAAAGSCTAALHLDPGSYTAHYRRGVAKALSGQAGSESDFALAAAMAPAGHPAHRAAAEAQHSTG